MGDPSNNSGHIRACCNHTAQLENAKQSVHAAFFKLNANEVAVVEVKGNPRIIDL